MSINWYVISVLFHHPVQYNYVFHIFLNYFNCIYSTNLSCDWNIFRGMVLALNLWSFPCGEAPFPGLEQNLGTTLSLSYLYLNEYSGKHWVAMDQCDDVNLKLYNFYVKVYHNRSIMVEGCSKSIASYSVMVNGVNFTRVKNYYCNDYWESSFLI